MNDKLQINVHSPAHGPHLHIKYDYHSSGRVGSTTKSRDPNFMPSNIAHLHLRRKEWTVVVQVWNLRHSGG